MNSLHPVQLDPVDSQNCLDEITRRAARVALGGHDAVRVPYICQLSGSAEELMLISTFAAERMVVATNGQIDVLEARLLALVHIAKLCITDIAELMHMSTKRCQVLLDDLERRGLVFSHNVDGMACYVQNEGEVHSQFTDLALGALHA
ncbi:hypothetical protein V5T82_12995 [Magnetovibrio sp. PR-2]|uniref:hypothetical protein n=1 Tax=Magnetovibrio sp. PR-2 TaxID=3120356 RepID=UPI002FCE4703